MTKRFKPENIRWNTEFSILVLTISGLCGPKEDEEDAPVGDINRVMATFGIARNRVQSLLEAAEIAGIATYKERTGRRSTPSGWVSRPIRYWRLEDKLDALAWEAKNRAAYEYQKRVAESES